MPKKPRTAKYEPRSPEATSVKSVSTKLLFCCSSIKTITPTATLKSLTDNSPTQYLERLGDLAGQLPLEGDTDLALDNENYQHGAIVVLRYGDVKPREVRYFTPNCSSSNTDLEFIEVNSEKGRTAFEAGILKPTMNIAQYGGCEVHKDAKFDTTWYKLVEPLKTGVSQYYKEQEEYVEEDWDEPTPAENAALAAAAAAKSSTSAKKAPSVEPTTKTIHVAISASTTHKGKDANSTKKQILGKRARSDYE